MNASAGSPSPIVAWVSMSLWKRILFLPSFLFSFLKSPSRFFASWSELSSEQKGLSPWFVLLLLVGWGNALVGLAVNLALHLSGHWQELPLLLRIVLGGDVDYQGWPLTILSVLLTPVFVAVAFLAIAMVLQGVLKTLGKAKQGWKASFAVLAVSQMAQIVVLPLYLGFFWPNWAWIVSFAIVLLYIFYVLLSAIGGLSKAYGMSDSLATFALFVTIILLGVMALVATLVFNAVVLAP